MTIFTFILILVTILYVEGSWLSFLGVGGGEEHILATSEIEVGVRKNQHLVKTLPTPSPSHFNKTWRKHTRDKVVLDIQLESDKRGLLVTITFNDRVCNRTTYDSYFTEAEFKDIMTEQLGPDEIVVELSGASLQSRLAKTYDFCRHYFVHFQVPKSGSYRLRVTRLRSDYHALRQLDEFPKMDIDVIMDEAVNHLDKYIPEPCTESNGYWVFREDVAKNYNIMEKPVFLDKTCIPGNDIRGIPEGYSSHITVGKSIDEGNRCGMDVTNYNWNRQICSNPPGNYAGDIVHIADKNRTDTRDRTFKLFKDKKILFVGDSHMRGLSEMFLDFVCKFKPDERDHQMFNKITGYQLVEMSKTKAYEYKKKVGASCHRRNAGPECYQLYDDGCQGLYVDYLGNYMCEPTSLEKAHGYDFVIFNCGHHPASRFHYKYEKYRNAVYNMIHEIPVQLAIKNGKTKFFWLENTAQPLRQDHWVFDKKDWRTLHRLYMFDKIAKQEMGKANFPYRLIHAFHSTLALFDKMCDCAHYIPDAKMPQLLALIDQIRRAMDK